MNSDAEEAPIICLKGTLDITRWKLYYRFILNRGGNMMNGAKCCCLIQVLKEAARNIGEDYFRTEFAESQSGYKYRERIYTYELYHQLRLVIENLGWRLVLHGEMDKRAHTNPDIKNKIPDMILHIPGTHENNLLVLEVKTYENAVRHR
ncbi:MAG: hypothetical protein L3J76_01090 [Candidatus Hydrothermae bacterium]|nr:hypothetical protein [Candidatus Hydrothermae bacterium]